MVGRLSIAMSFVLSAIIAVYEASLQPIASLYAVGVIVTPMDIVIATRRAFILRQLRETFHREHVHKSKPAQVESRAHARGLLTVLVMACSGEAIVGALLHPIIAISR